MEKKNIFLNFDSDGSHHKHAIELCVADLTHAFEYVEPHDSNIAVFSHRFYEILIRACTEFESIAKTVLRAKGQRIRNNASIRDYFALTQHFSLDCHYMWFGRWNPHPIAIFPFREWTQPSIGPDWYRCYNKVKHSRHDDFPKATLENALRSVAAVVVVLSVAYGPGIFNPSGWAIARSENGYTTEFFADKSLGFGTKIEIETNS